MALITTHESTLGKGYSLTFNIKAAGYRDFGQRRSG